MNRFEMMMDFKRLFETQRSDILAAHGLIDGDMELQKDDLLDEVDMTTVEMTAQMKSRLLNREALFLKKINQALRRIQDGTFGICDTCGDAIEYRRLEARPTASLCVGCKEEQERQESMHIDGRRCKSLGAKLRMIG
jgi:DnaK suppressor protein